MGEPPHLLVVDDHREIRDALAKYLTKHDYRVSSAESAVAARRILDNSRIDLVVLDIMMPGEDGLSLCRHLSESKNIPCLLYTSDAADE